VASGSDASIPLGMPIRDTTISRLRRRETRYNNARGCATSRTFVRP
jgi:hypothetical protein